MISYENKEIEIKGCPGCAYAKHQFDVPCGIAYENERFILSQDWEVPILGFFIVSPKKHIEKLEELTKNERDEMFDIVDKTIKILRENNICDRFDIIFEEREDKHSHVWIIPRYAWMNEICDRIIKNIGTILEYAKKNFRTRDVYEQINQITKIVKKILQVKNIIRKILKNYNDTLYVILMEKLYIRYFCINIRLKNIKS